MVRGSSRAGFAAGLAVLGLASTSCLLISEECLVTDVRVVVDDEQTELDLGAAPSDLVRCSPHAVACVGVAGEVYVPGGLAHLYFPDAPSPIPSTDATLFGISEGPSGLVAVGEAGSVFHWNFETWQETQLEGDLLDVVHNDREVVIVGDAVIYASEDDAQGWAPIDAGLEPGEVLRHVLCLADGSFLAVGDNGLVLHGDSASGPWERWDAPSSDSFSAALATRQQVILGDASGSLWALDAAAALASNAPSSDDWYEESIPGDGAITALAGNGILWAVREDGSVSYSPRTDVWEQITLDPQTSPTVALWTLESEGYDSYGYYYFQTVEVIGTDGDVTSFDPRLDPIHSCSY